MKRFAICLTVVAVSMLAVPAYAVDLTGKFSVGGFLDYGMGFGEAYDDIEYIETYMREGATVTNAHTETTKLGLSFGGYVMYHFTPQMAVMGLIDYQTVKWEWTCIEEVDVGGFVVGTTESGEETENWIVLGANIVYFLMSEGNTMPYFMGGPAMYMPSAEGADSRLGFNGGVGILHFLQENLAFNGGARFHYITLDDGGFADAPSSATHLEIFAGATLFFGGEY